MYLPIQQEADLSVALPVEVPPDTAPTTLPSEQKIVIRPNCDVFLNGSLIIKKSPEGTYDVSTLATLLTRLKKMADDGKVQTIVTIIPDGDAEHQASMSILDACARAGIKQVSFSDAI